MLLLSCAQGWLSVLRGDYVRAIELNALPRVIRISTPNIALSLIETREQLIRGRVLQVCTLSTEHELRGVVDVCIIDNHLRNIF